METELEMKVVVATASCVVSGKDLTKAVQAAKKVVEKRSTLPVLQNVFVASSGGSLIISATNLEVGVLLHIPCVSSQFEFAITVPPEPLIAAAKSGRVEFTLIDETTLKVNGMILKGIEAGDFPPFPELPDNMRPIPDLADAIKHTAFAASKEYARPVLLGIQFDNGTAAATDGFTLATHPVHYSGDPLVILASGLAKFANIIGDDARLGYETHRGLAYITSGNMTLYCILITGRFPDWKSIVPKKTEHSATFDPDAMIAALQSVGAIAKESNNRVMFVQDDDSILLSAKDNDTGSATANVSITGDIAQIAFNFKYVIEYLKSIEGRVTIKMSNGRQAALFECGKSTCLIMPMFLG